MLKAFITFGVILAVIAVMVRLSTPQATGTLNAGFNAGTNIFRGAFGQ